MISLGYESVHVCIFVGIHNILLFNGTQIIHLFDLQILHPGSLHSQKILITPSGDVCSKDFFY